MKTLLAILGVVFIAGILLAIGFSRGFFSSYEFKNLIGTGCDPDNYPFTKKGEWSKACVKCDTVTNCDTSRDGWDCDGFPNMNCGTGFGRTAQGTPTCRQTCDTRYSFKQNYWNNLYNTGQMNFSQWQNQIAIITKELDCCVTKCTNPNAQC